MTTGHRKVLFGLAALMFLAAGFRWALANPAAGQVIFTQYATAVVGIVTAIALGTTAEHFAKKGGSK